MSTPPSTIPMRTKLAFGLGASAESVVNVGLISFSLFLYNNVLGVPATLCGLAAMIALTFDAISDPLIGAISDRWRSRWGRRHPFLFASAIPLGLSFAAIYAPPGDLGERGLFLWLTGWTIAMRQSLTLYQIPHIALGAELSEDYIERSRIMSYNALFTMIGSAGTYLAAWTWFDSQPGSTENGANFLAIGIAGGLFATATVLASAWFTRDRIPLMRTPSNDPPLSVSQFTREIGDCLRNPNYRALLLGLVFMGMAVGLHATVNAYMSRFFWELEGSDIRWFGTVFPVSYLLAFAVIPILHRRCDKRGTLIGGVILVAVAVITPVGLRLLGSFPENGDPWVWRWLMLGTFGYHLGLALLTITAFSALADVADEHEVATGRRQEGILYAARTFFAKVTHGLGFGIGGIVVDAIGFEPGSAPGTVDPNVLFRMGLLEGPGVALTAVVALFVYAAYRIDREQYENIRAELDVLRASRPA